MPLRIAIVGGGLGGLTLVAALSQLHLEGLVEVDVYESAPALTQVGAGITLWPRAWDIYKKLGMEESLIAHLAPGQKAPTKEPRLNFLIRKSDQKESVLIHELIFGGSALFFHRAILLDLLLKHTSTSCVRYHLSHRLTNYTEQPDGVVHLTFSDGRNAVCDLLVGADGLKSVVRRDFIAQRLEPSLGSDPVWSGTFAYRCMLDSKIIAAKLPTHSVLTTPMIYCGKNKHIVAYPMLEHQAVNIIAYVSDPTKEGTKYDGPSFTDVTKEEIVPVYAGWEEEVVVIVQNMEKASRWAIHEIKALDCYARGRVLLLGDAAHAMTPHQGNGAGQAIEDAYILAHLVSKALHDGYPIHKVSEVYDRIRQPFGNFVQAASRKHGFLYEFNVPEFADVQEHDDTVSPERLQWLAKTILDDWEYAWTTVVDDDLDKALALLCV